MRALLDTNIIIHRENTKATNYGIGLLFYWLDKLNYEKCIHPFVIEELRSFQIVSNLVRNFIPEKSHKSIMLR